MFKTLLCIPPDYEYKFPPLGTPAIVGFLKKKGVSCSQIDLNLRYRDFLTQHVSGPVPLNREERLFFLKPLLSKFFTQNLTDRYYSHMLPRDSDDIFPRLPYGNNTNSSFFFGERLLSSDILWKYLEDAEENTFYQFYLQEGIIRRLEKEDIRLFGISVISPAQAVASLTLGLLVKKALPDVHVTIGGQWPTLYRHAIVQNKDLFRCFDSVVVFEGESAFYEMAVRLERGGSVSPVPNVMTQDTASAETVARRDEDMNGLPCPDFDGLPLGDYSAGKGGQVSLTFETSRGCYWSKCAYCVDLPLPKPSYRAKSADIVVNDIKELKSRYNAQYLLLGDPGLSPRQMRAISEKMLRDGVAMEWWTMARLDPGFNAELFELAYSAGLRQINFGFESANDRVCDLLDKGNLRERSSRIIRECARSGIKVDLQTIAGLPGESFEEGLETVDFLIAHKEYIASVTFNFYYLSPGNHVYRDPGKYGIAYDRTGPMPFRFFTPFRNINGMDMAQAYLLEKMHYSLLHKDDPAAAEKNPDPGAYTADGYADLSLNGESCRLRYRKDPRTEEYMFIEHGDTNDQKHAPVYATD
ncbi:MAG: radical SAM protein [Candidatus Omnitrophota bacterium]